MKKLFILGLVLLSIGCGKPFHALHDKPLATNPSIDFTVPTTLFPISNAVITVNAFGENLAKLKQKKGFPSLFIETAYADVAQANGVVSITYNRSGVTSFTLGTSGFMTGSFPNVSGDDLNLGSISISALDDNSLRVCTGVGAPANKCNRLYIRVFTLGSNIANTITGVPGFINVDSVTSPYSLDVLAGSVLTPVGFNSNANAPTVANAATVFSYTIPGSNNRVRLTNTGPISFPVKADLSNAGSGNYEMKLVIQYALGYVP